MPLSEKQIQDALTGPLSIWAVDQGAITRQYHTKDWAQNQLLIGAIAFICEACCHHPELIVHWNRVTVRLHTHDAGGITQKDIETARRIESHVIWLPENGSVLQPMADQVNGDWVH